jgi:predicted HTH transcriptional regulator
MDKKYIVWFQSVTSVGIMVSAKDNIEAQEKAKIKFQEKDVFKNCIFEQTEFELTDSEEWKPEIETHISEDGLGWKFVPSDKTKEAIAKKLGKKSSQLVESDLQGFIKESVEKSLKNHA